MLRRLYLANAALLTVHEIDAAYWREWDLFQLPGGRSAFLALHVALVIVVVWGYGRVRSGSRTGLWLSLGLACAGMLAVVVHGLLLLRGGAEFRTTSSIGLLAAAGAVSLAQVAAVLATWRRGPPGGFPAGAEAEAEILRVVERYWEAMGRNDWAAAGRLLHDDFVLEWPQSGERIRGRDRFVAVNANYPAAGPWRFTVHRIVADGRGAASDVGVTGGAVSARALTFFEVRAGLVARAVEFWPDPFPPAPWRASWVERAP